MRLDEFKVGDKVRYNAVIGEIPPHLYSTILYIGKEKILLRNWRGVEFLRERDAEDFELWRPKPTYDELYEQNKRLRAIGFDLYTSIRDAAWTQIDPHTGDESPNLRGPTPHMRSASESWKAEDDRV